jgi:hypothetical protein
MRNFGATEIETGKEFSWWERPISWTAQTAGEWWYGPSEGGADAGIVSGNCIDSQGLLGPPGATVTCAALRAAIEGKAAGTYESYTPPVDWTMENAVDAVTGGKAGEEKPPRKDPFKIPTWAYVAVGGVGVLGAFLYFRRQEA